MELVWTTLIFEPNYTDYELVDDHCTQNCTLTVILIKYIKIRLIQIYYKLNVISKILLYFTKVLCVALI